MTIVTLPSDVGKQRGVSFEVIGVYSDRTFIVDLSARWNDYASVAEATQPVFEHCSAAYGARSLVCDDPKSGWLKITPAQDGFDITPYQDPLPALVDWKYPMARQHRDPSWGSV